MSIKRDEMLDFLHNLLTQGVELHPNGEQLVCRGPKSVLTSQTLSRIKQHKLDILAALRESSQDYPLSHGQLALWFEYQMAPESAAYNVSFAVSIHSAVEAVTLKRAFQLLLNRHPALRITIELTDGEPKQRIPLYQTVNFTHVEAASLTQEELQQQLKHHHAQPFDLHQGPVFRVILFSRSNQDHTLLFSAHHIACDGVSLGIMVEELPQLYQFVQQTGRIGTSPSLALAPLFPTYPDYIALQNAALADDAERLWTFWQQKLSVETANIPLPVLNLPTDYARPAVWTPQGASYGIDISPELTQQLRNLARQQGVTLYMLLLAAYQVLLYRYTGQAKIWVASPLAGRTGFEAAVVVGYFVSPTIMPADFSDNPTFQTFLQQVRQTVSEVLTHQAYPFALLVEQLQPTRDPTRPRLTQAAFALQKLHQAELFSPSSQTATNPIPWGDFLVSPLELGTLEGMYEIQLELLENSDSLSGAFKYNTTLFNEATIQQLADHYQQLLINILQDVTQPVVQLQLLTTNEQQQLLDWNNTQADYARDKCLHHLFEEQVQRTPQATAAIFDDLTPPLPVWERGLGGEGNSLTYSQLNKQANQVAHLLRTVGVGPDVVVAICVERSIKMMVGLLGILKAGGAYLPLDPGYPTERIAFMLADSQTAILLTQSHLQQKIPAGPYHTIYLDTEQTVISRQPDTDPNLTATEALTSQNLAYVIYTSGSTGRPKGVQISHQAVVNFLTSMQHHPGLTVQDVLLAVTTLSFDIAVLELYLPLITGAQVIITSAEIAADGVQLQTLLQRHQVTIMQATPATWSMLITSGWQGTPPLKVLCGGEALPKSLAGALVARSNSVWNMYGPTETTVWSAVYQLEATNSQQDGAMPIGWPIANTQLYIVDQHLQLAPYGIPGELLIGGDGLARGYLNRPELTADRFITNPFVASEGTGSGRLYKTGDLVRRLADGNIEFLGRIDHQVKVRGFRIELGEIETQLGKHPHIKDAVLVARGQQTDDKHLVAYIQLNVADQPLPIDPVDHKHFTHSLFIELRHFLQKTLPDYMLPTAFVVLDTFPLTPNGKINRLALPEPTRPVPLEKFYAAPKTELETLLLKIWQDVLQLEQVGIHNNFFDLGGHSLLLVRVHSRLKALQNPAVKALRMVDLLRYPTIQSLAQHLTPSPLKKTEAASGPKPHLQPTNTNEIAIVGLAGRFPGGETLQEFWQSLCQGQESITFFTEQELQLAGVDPELLKQANYVKAGAILADIAAFDADFFGFSRREAQLLDPQVRLFMMCAWEALEQANCDPNSYEGKIGIYAGAGRNGYFRSNLQGYLDAADPASSYQAMIFNDKDFLATQVAYKLNLNGPGVTVQTACSTSLVAVHLAAQALRQGDCKVALAGGVAIQVPHKTGYIYQPGMILSPDGHCRAFDDQAAGTVSGNGIGLVVLKRLEDALAEGDVIHAVIKGSAINNDGAMKLGYTAPSVEGQIEVISEALAQADVPPDSITFIETHGTATPLGDPIELTALIDVFRAKTDKQNFCHLGALKTNIGHLDTAAGIAGLIKTVLALKHKTIPPTLHFTTPNARIDLTHSPFIINTKLIPWDISATGTDTLDTDTLGTDTLGTTPLRAGVSSFGIGGTNAHIILEEAPLTKSNDQLATNSKPLRWQLLTLSAKNKAALRDLAQRYIDFFTKQPDVDLAAVCHTTHLGRSHFTHRLSLTAQSVAAIQQQLLSFVTAQTHPNIKQDNIPQQHSKPKTAFFFSGQGTQYVDMGRKLYQTQPVFRQAIDVCHEILAAQEQISLLDILYPKQDTQKLGHRKQEPDTALNNLQFTIQTNVQLSHSQLDQTIYTQPALFALEYALVQLWQSWGIIPDVVLGHSVGEIVAACVAGVFTLEDGLKLVAARGRLMQSLPQDGAMVLVRADEAQMQQLLAPYQSQVSIAAFNGPQNIVISGQQEAVQNIVTELNTKEIKTHKLTVSHAFHSPLMEPILADFEQIAQEITFNPPQYPLISNLSGQLITHEIATPDYWIRHIRQPVRFAEGIAAFKQTGCTVAIEIGPKPTLLSMAQQCYPNSSLTWLPTLRSGRDDEQQILESLGQLYIQGLEINWSEFEAGQGPRQKVTLPTYPFQCQSYWIDPPPKKETIQSLRPLIDTMIRLQQQQQIVFETEFSLATQPYLAEHRLYGALVSPGAYHLALILNASDLALEPQSYWLEDIIFPEALVIPDDGLRLAQLTLTADKEQRYKFSLTSVAPESTFDHKPALHATGYLRATSKSKQEPVSITALRKHCPVVLDLDSLYAKTEQRVLHGPSFRWITRMWRSEGEAGAKALGQLRLPDMLQDLSGHQIHPGLLDACFQVAGLVFSDQTENLMLPFALESLHLYQIPTSNEWWCAVQQITKNKWDIQLLDTAGQVLAEISGFQRRAATPQAITQSDDAWRQWLYQLEWEAAPQTESASQAMDVETDKLQGGQYWLIFADDNGLGRMLADKLHQSKQHPIVVYRGTVYQADPNGQSVMINPNLAQDYQQLLDDTPPIYGVIHLWGLDTPPATSGLDTPPATSGLGTPPATSGLGTPPATSGLGTPPATSLNNNALLEAATKQSCGTVLHLVQMLTRSKTQRPRLWLVTHQAQAVVDGDTVPGVIQAPLWGMGRVITLEQPDLHCTCIDIDENTSATNLFAEIVAASTAKQVNKPTENQIALRQGTRYVARLAKFKLPPSTKRLPIQAANTYLITGALGGLGLQVAHWLASQGAKYMLLLGRTLPTPDIQAQLDGLTASGVTVTVIQADVTDREQLAATLAHHHHPAHPLRGIIHAAGVLDDGVLFRQSWERFAKVLAPKVWGTWNLHQLTLNMPLDFFVTFASASGLLGNQGQASYVAANVFMDALAHHRRAQGLPALSINWGTWSQVGMAAEFAKREQANLQARGHGTISPQQGIRALAALLSQNITQVGVMSIDWPKYLNQFVQLPPFFDNITVENPHSQTQFGNKSFQNKPKELSPSLPQQLQPLSNNERKTKVFAYLQNEISQSLGLNHLPDVEQGFTELGLDSLMALSLRSRLENDFELSLPATLIFEHPNIESLAEYLLKEVQTHDTPTIEKPSTDQSQSEAKAQDNINQQTDIEQLSVSELINKISNEFNARQ